MKALFYSLLTLSLLFSTNSLVAEPTISKKLNVYLKKNKAVLPKAALKFYEEGDVKRGHTELFLSPEAAKKTIQFETVLSEKSFFQKMIWQVSRTQFPVDAYSNDPLTPPNLILSGELNAKKFDIDFARVINKLQHPPSVAAREHRSAVINSSGVKRSGISSSGISRSGISSSGISKARLSNNKKSNPFIFMPINQMKAGDGFKIYANQAKLDINIPLYVRVVPIRIDRKRSSPIVIGLPSRALKVTWGRDRNQSIDFSTFEIGESIKYNLELVEFKFSPYKFTKNWPSGCKKTPRDEGKTFPSNVIDSISDGYNWASTTFDRVVYYVSSVFNLFERLAGLISSETAAIILDQVLSEVGIPPNLQNAHKIYADGADYLAVQSVDKIPEPGPGDYGDEFYRKSQLTWGEMKSKAKADMRELIVDVSRKIYHKEMQDTTYCQNRVENPYLIIKIRNQSKQKYTNISFKLTDDEGLFVPIHIPLAEILPKETVSIPVFYLNSPKLKIKSRSQLPAWDNRAALNDWWDGFYDEDFTFTLHGPRYKRCYKRNNECKTTIKKLFKSPDRNWFDEKAYQYSKH